VRRREPAGPQRGTLVFLGSGAQRAIPLHKSFPAQESLGRRRRARRRGRRAGLPSYRWDSPRGDALP
jgi:hypothetical protein